MPFGFIHSIIDFITPKPVSHQGSLTERLLKGDVIEATNDCGEKRYIQIRSETHAERRRSLEILLTKCKKLISSVTLEDHIHRRYVRIVKLTEKVREAMYMADDITDLIVEYEELERDVKKASSSFRNLSDAIV
jgi:hypothetical protein|tara:strand:- start:228 stop:629 length:402 start_codon:yes stop_codon:yes gene_type:complete